MSSSTISSRSRAIYLPRSPGVLLALCLGVAALAVLFYGEVSAAVVVWIASTAYSHCFFVLPIALFLGWERRNAIATTPVVPLPIALVLALPLAGVWLAAERLGIMEGRQLVAVAFLQVLFLATLGWRMWRAMSVPLLYLFFLVPFGAFVTPALQNFTARFTEIGLDVLGIPNYVDAFSIEIPEGGFYVAEACAGLRFLIASVAFGVLYACMIYRSPWRRIAFIGVSIIVPIIANGFRALGIVSLGHIIGNAQAAAADHLIYGWVFFSLVIILLILAGLPFREDGSPIAARVAQPGLDRPLSLAGGGMIVVAFIIIAAVGPATAAMIDRSLVGVTTLVRPSLVAPDGCTLVGSPTDLAYADAPAVRGIRQAANCGGLPMTVTVATLPVRSNPSLLLVTQRDATIENTAEDATTSGLSVANATPGVWRLTETREPTQITASSFWINGVPSQAGMTARARQGINSVLGAQTAPVLVAISIPFGQMPLAVQRTQLQALLVRFIQAQPNLDAEIRSQSVAAAR